ncbi:MAG: histidine phosphatase family protein [Clostridia bacterium]|nr:histidine phosphatase family protein [Clostridia bacterium]
MLFFYIRHGDPTYKPDALTPLGRRQAESVAHRLALYGIDRIFSSTSTRAYETAVPTAELLKKEITRLDFCNEHYAFMELSAHNDNGQRTWAFGIPAYRRLFMQPDVLAMGQHWYDHPAFADHPTFKSGTLRINTAVDELFASLGYTHDRETGTWRADNPTEDRVALFAHQGFGMSFLSSVLDIPYPLAATHFDMSHTGMTVIHFKNEDGIVIPRVLTLANDSHLYRDGLPTRYHNVIPF